MQCLDNRGVPNGRRRAFFATRPQPLLQLLGTRTRLPRAVATEGDELVQEMADHILWVPETPWLLSPVVTVIPLQMLAYHIASSRGLDVDQPRNLAKSVTVE